MPGLGWVYLPSGDAVNAIITLDVRIPIRVLYLSEGSDEMGVDF